MLILGYGVSCLEWGQNDIVNIRLPVSIRVAYFIVLRAESYNDIIERGILHIDGGIHIDG